MRIAVVHGYFLGDSGSAIYTRELAREFTRLGHDVTLVCQEQHPELYPFIDSVYDLDAGNNGLKTIYKREPVAAGASGNIQAKGRCRLVRPDISGRLLTYVAGPFPPFETCPFQDAPADRIEDFADANIKAMAVIFSLWPPDLIQANHAVLQPYIVREALKYRTKTSLPGDMLRPSPVAAAGPKHVLPPYIVTIHGSELNFTVRNDPRMAPYMVEGLAGAAAIATLSESSRAEAVELAAENGLDIAPVTVVLPPGVDTVMFSPSADHAAALRAVSPAIAPALDDIAVFAGRLLWTKGLQYVIAALPFILRERPRFQLIIVGDGPMRPALDKLLQALGDEDMEKARELTASEDELRSAPEYGAVLPAFKPDREKMYRDGARHIGRHVHFTGHLPHHKLAPLFAAADISLAPSVFPEAFGLVSIEALSAGALPVATYQTGLRAPLDVVAGELSDTTFRRLVPGMSMTTALAETVTMVLERYPTKERDFHKKLHHIAERSFSWAVVAREYLRLAD